MSSRRTPERHTAGFIAFPILVFAATLVIGAVGYLGYYGFVAKNTTIWDGDTFCTQEAKLCPDGSVVGRIGPNCEFGECPAENALPSERAESKEAKEVNPSTSSGDKSAPADSAALTASYINTKYLFGFRYPEGYTPYIAVDRENKILLPAGANADRVVIAEDEAQIFSGSPKTLAFDVIREDISIDRWLASSLQKYIPSAHFISQKNINFAGRNSVEVIGNGTDGSVYKLVVVKPGNFAIAIAQSAPSRFLDKILSTFTFNVQELNM